MEQQVVKARPTRRADVMKVLLLGGLTVQGFGALMGLGLIILNVMTTFRL